ncbi:MAG: heavy-metal-associated domain-containing protein [Bacteroidetes bacterium]|nr:heavy-metal-associated domain-containing protein [Bacteroidota bacterium]
MKNMLSIIILFISFQSNAQVNSVNLQASGLTCSMCSNAINKALRTVPYVTDVKADIKNSSFSISFKPGARVDFDELKKKVEGAGFHVAKLTATIHFNNLKVENDTHVNVDGMTMHFLHVKNQTLNGEIPVQVLDKGFVSAKEFKKNESFTKMSCYKTGVAGTCCSKAGIATGERVYHVSI